METKELAFKALHVAHLNHDDAMALFWSTYKLAIPAREHIGTTANAILTELIGNTDACRAQTHRPRKSPLSDRIKTLRKTCNNQWAETKRTISFAAQSSNSALSKPGQELKFFFKPNWNIQQEALPTQIEITTQLIKRYRETANIRAAAQAIGIDALLDQLEATNAELSANYRTRTNEISSRPPSGTNLRPAANDSYMQFCTAIEQAARYTPNNELVKLFGEMNEYRKETHKLLAGKKKETATE